MPASRLTILQLVPDLDSGGVERGTLEVGTELVRRGHRSLVVSGGGRLVEQLEREGSQHFTASIGRKSLLTIRWIGWLRNLIRSESVDVVHVRSRVPGWVCRFALHGLADHERPRLVTTVHGQYSVSRYSEIMTAGDAVIAVSRTIRDYVLDNYLQVPENRLHLIYRGVDPLEFPRGFQPDDAWRAVFDEQFPQARNRWLITLPGRITRLKGHSEFIRLIRNLLDHDLPVHGLIVGGEDSRRKQYARELRQAVQLEGLDGHITFTGHRSDMKELYAVSRLVLSLSSKPESFGRTVLEALNLGTPVVGYAHGGVGEILTDLFPQGAVPCHDIATLCDRARSVLQSKIPVRPVNSYRLSEMLNATVDLYEDLCGLEASHHLPADSRAA